MVLFFVEKRKKNDEEMGEGRRGCQAGHSLNITERCIDKYLQQLVFIGNFICTIDASYFLIKMTRKYLPNVFSFHDFHL